MTIMSAWDTSSSLINSDPLLFFLVNVYMNFAACFIAHSLNVSKQSEKYQAIS